MKRMLVGLVLGLLVAGAAHSADVVGDIIADDVTVRGVLQGVFDRWAFDEDGNLSARVFTGERFMGIDMLVAGISDFDTIATNSSLDSTLWLRLNAGDDVRAVRMYITNSSPYAMGCSLLVGVWQLQPDTFSTMDFAPLFESDTLRFEVTNAHDGIWGLAVLDSTITVPDDGEEYWLGTRLMDGGEYGHLARTNVSDDVGVIHLTTDTLTRVGFPSIGVYSALPSDCDFGYSVMGAQGVDADEGSFGVLEAEYLVVGPEPVPNSGTSVGARPSYVVSVSESMTEEMVTLYEDAHVWRKDFYRDGSQVASLQIYPETHGLHYSCGAYGGFAFRVDTNAVVHGYGGFEADDAAIDTFELAGGDTLFVQGGLVTGYAAP